MAKKVTVERVPEYLIGYIFNGDETGLDEADKELWDRWAADNLPKGWIPVCDNQDESGGAYFTERPVVGLPTTVIDVEFYV